jgi:hypothetical protein
MSEETTTQEPRRLQDPYDPKRRKIVTSISVDDEDRAFLFSLCPHQSVLQITLNVLMEKYVKALKTAGLRSYNPERYKEALGKVAITVPAWPKRTRHDGEPKEVAP